MSRLKTKLAFLILCAAVLGMSSAVARAATMVTVEMNFNTSINWGDNNNFSGVLNIGTDLNGFTSVGTVLFPPNPCAGGPSSVCFPPNPCAGATSCTESNVVALPSSGMPKWNLSDLMFNTGGMSYSVGLMINGVMSTGPFDLYFATGMNDPGIPLYDLYYNDPIQVGTFEIFATTTPLPAALPLFATGLGVMGLLGWRRKRKNAAALAAA
jgi:hypothetical protein